MPGQDKLQHGLPDAEPLGPDGLELFIDDLPVADDRKGSPEKGPDLDVHATRSLSNALDRVDDEARKQLENPSEAMTGRQFGAAMVALPQVSGPAESAVKAWATASNPRFRLSASGANLGRSFGTLSRLPTLLARPTIGDFGAPVGCSISAQDKLYVLTIAMMLGLRYSVLWALLTSSPQQDLFSVPLAFHEFPPSGSSEPSMGVSLPKPAHQLTVDIQFKDYFPFVFREIRKRAGINSKEYVDSVAGHLNFMQFQSNSKSGQFFFFSPDGNFMVKTISKKEAKCLRASIQAFLEHYTTNPQSFLCRITGLHRVRLPGWKKMYFIVMESVFAKRERSIHLQYDLKGSRVGRTTKAGQSVRKDNDFRDCGQRFLLADSKTAFVQQLRRDTEFLKNLGFMDYSLLVGIHDESEQNSHVAHYNIEATAEDDMRSKTLESCQHAEREFQTAFETDRHCAQDARAQRTSRTNGIAWNIDGSIQGVGFRYYLAIIDYLVVFDAKKVGESYGKMLLCKPRKDISAVGPQFYAQRFIGFMENHVN